MDNELHQAGERASLNLDHDEARALHRIVRAMHDGECPKCHKVSDAQQMRFYQRELAPGPNGTNRPLVVDKYKSGWRCPHCAFEITIAETDEVLRIFGPFMERNLAIFEKWRAERASR